MRLFPLADRVVVRPIAPETVSAGGIIIPPTAQEKVSEGVVSAVGDDEAIKVKVGDRVVYDKYAGTPIKVDGRDLLILKASDVLAKVGD